jgi:hypothetical protein
MEMLKSEEAAIRPSFLKQQQQEQHTTTADTTQQTFLHELDLFLRKAASAVQQSFSTYNPLPPLTSAVQVRKNISKSLTEAKKEVLTFARERLILQNDKDLIGRETGAIEMETKAEIDTKAEFGILYDIFRQRVKEALVEEQEEVRLLVDKSLCIHLLKTSNSKF